MKALVQRVYTNPSYAKIFEWGRLVSITSSSQLLIQAIGFICGIFVIRVLPTSEYGLYTLANTMFGTLKVLADGGISTSVMAQGGKVWQNREQLGTVVATGFHLRKKFGFFSLLLAIPILLYLLRQHNASWLTSTLIVASLIPAFFATLSGYMLVVGPTLHQAIVPLQKIEVGVSIGRASLLLLSLFMFPFSYIALFSASIPLIWGNVQLRKISNIYTNWTQKPDPIVQKNITAVVKRILPGSIYYCLSGQINIWLISIFGSTASVAQVGALSRVSVMLGLFSSVFGMLIIPRFARLRDNSTILFRRFTQIMIGLIFFAVIVILTASVLPTQLLSMLGKNYSGLENEIILSISGSCISLIAGSLFGISASRNWIINPLVSIPLTLATIICCASLINISSLAGILKFNIVVSSAEVIIYFVYCLLKINKAQTI